MDKELTALRNPFCQLNTARYPCEATVHSELAMKSTNECRIPHDVFVELPSQTAHAKLVSGRRGGGEGLLGHRCGPSIAWCYNGIRSTKYHTIYLNNYLRY
jgi:hypothetical protein